MTDSISDIQDILAILPSQVSNTIIRLSDKIQKKLKGRVNCISLNEFVRKEMTSYQYMQIH